MITRTTFTKEGRTDPTTIHEVTFAIKQKNIDKLESLLLERSTPGSPQYGKWLTFEAVGEMTSNKESTKFVKKWLENEKNINITWMATREEYFKAKAPVGVWEKLFQTTFFNWIDRSPHSRYSKHIIRAEEYFIPVELNEHVEAVFNTVQAPPVIHKRFHHKPITASPGIDQEITTTEYKTVVKPNLRRVREAMSLTKGRGEQEGKVQVADAVVTVAFLNSYYGITSNAGSSEATQSVFETGGENWSSEDLNTFQVDYNLTVASAIELGMNSQNISQCTFEACGEGNLDIQYIMGVAQGTTSYWYYVGYAGGDPYVAFVTDLASDPNPPYSNSMSYGSVEQVQ